MLGFVSGRVLTVNLAVLNVEFSCLLNRVILGWILPIVESEIGGFIDRFINHKFLNGKFKTCINVDTNNQSSKFS